MVRFLKTISVIISFVLIQPAYTQSNADSLIFIKLNTVYKSNLIDFGGSDLLMLKFKTIPKSFTYDGIFCELTKGTFRSSNSITSNAIVDSLSKMFYIYKVSFNESENGKKADSILTKSIYYTGYLVPLLEDRGVVSYYILQRWTQRFSYVKYRLTSWDCNDNHQCCMVNIESVR